MLKRHLKGAAADYIGKEGEKHMNYEQIWAALKKKYSKAWLQTRTATNNLFEIEAPSDNHESIEAYMNKRKDALSAMKRLAIDLEQAITNDTLNNLPQSFREKLDEKLIPLHEDFKMSFEEMADQVNNLLITGDKKTSKTPKTPTKSNRLTGT